jgi:hypothetical protein
MQAFLFLGWTSAKKKNHGKSQTRKLAISQYQPDVAP